MLLGVVAGGPSVPPPTVTVEIAPQAAVNAPVAPTRAQRAASPAKILDPFVAPGPRVVVAAPAQGLQDPFAAPNLSARFRHTAKADSGLHDPFSS